MQEIDQEKDLTSFILTKKEAAAARAPTQKNTETLQAGASLDPNFGSKAQYSPKSPSSLRLSLIFTDSIQKQKLDKYLSACQPPVSLVSLQRP